MRHEKGMMALVCAPSYVRTIEMASRHQREVGPSSAAGMSAFANPESATHACSGDFDYSGTAREIGRTASQIGLESVLKSLALK